MPLTRVLEPEIMSGAEQASEYDEMDFSATDQLFAERAAQLAPPGAAIVDIGCGNAKIPLTIAGLVPRGTRIYAVEMSFPMLAVAARNRARAGVNPAHVHLIAGDAKRLPFGDASIRLAVSNSLVHHIPDPREMFREVGRLVGPHGAILIRDLVRPESEADVQRLVATYASGWSELQTRLFADSLRAALTVDEVRQMLNDAGVAGVTVTQITDRHWSAERAA